MKRIILLSLIFVSFIATSAPAAIRVVSPDDYTTIQAAIDDANDGDTVMITPGTYTGPGNRDIDFRGKAITVRSVAPENPHIVAATVIDCNGSETEPNRGFYFHSYEDGNSVLEGLTITNGYAEQGGAIYCYSSDPTIANCSFTANTAISGGGLYCRGSSPVVTNCTFSQNLADGSGGGLYCEENRYLGPGMLIANCTFNQNLADMGGGLYCGDKYPAGSSPTITNCTFADNSADNGGGVYCGGEHTGSNPTITNCTFNENAAYHSGGGMYCSAPSSPTIRYCTFTGNSACGQAIDYYYRYGGGAVYGCRGEIRHCTITYNRTKANGGGLHRCSRVVNSLISGNTAGQDGGGTYGCNQIANCVVTGNSATWRGGGTLMGYYDIWIWLADYAPPEYFGAVEQAAIYGYYDYDYEIITNCTITANRAGFEEGGGVFCYYGSFPLTNSILWANAAASGTGESAQIGGATPDVTFSCIQDDDPDDDYIPFGGEENGNIDDNPMFVRSADDGADGWGDDPCTPDVNEAANDDFGDLHLTLTSPCINTGDPGYTAAWNHVDMDGQPRVIGGRVDMGADEYALIILVTRPEPGEVWVSGSKHEVKWESHGAAGTVDILLSTNSGSDWTKIEDNIANTGSYFWHLPEEVDSNQCVISVVPGSPNPDVICIDSGVFTIHPDTPGPVVPSRWPSLGGDFDRAGLSANYGPELGCVKWQFKTEGAVSASPTIGAEDRVHIACEDGKLYTLDANGALLWSCDTNSPLISAPTVGPDGSVYVGSESGKLYVIDINGNVRWTHRADGFIYSSPAVSPETNDVYVCSSDGTLYALAQDGSELWSFQTGRAGVIGSAIFASPALGSDGTVYVGGFNDANLYALDPDDGSVRWVRSLDFTCPYYTRLSGGRAFASPVVAPDGTIYQTLLFDPNLYAIDPETGNILWSLWFAEPPGPYDQIESDVDGWSEPALGPDGTIYVSLNDPCLRAVNPGGTIKWVTQLGMDDGFMLTVGRDGLIYAAGYDGYLCVVHPDGNELSRFQSDGWLTPPVISADNTIIVSDANNRILAIGGEGCEEQVSVLHRPYDLNGSRNVDFLDFALLAADWLPCNDPFPPLPDEPPLAPCAVSWDGTYSTGDINRDLYVDYTDLAAIANRWLGEE